MLEAAWRMESKKGKKKPIKIQRNGNMLEAERKTVLFRLLTPGGRSCGREYHVVFLV